MSTALSCAPLTQGNSTEALCSYQDKQTECYGLKNAVAEAVISAQYDYIYDGDIVGGKWGIISCAGEIIAPLVHSSSEDARKALQEGLLHKIGFCRVYG